MPRGEKLNFKACCHKNFSDQPRHPVVGFYGALFCLHAAVAIRVSFGGGEWQHLIWHLSKARMDPRMQVGYCVDIIELGICQIESHFGIASQFVIYNESVFNSLHSHQKICCFFIFLFA